MKANKNNKTKDSDMEMAECIECGEEYNPKRLALGYSTCLDCGDMHARKVYTARTKASLHAMTPNAASGGVDESLLKPRELVFVKAPRHSA